MITYSDGTEARVGDHVDYDGTPAVVEEVIDTQADLESWELDERGLMLRADLTLNVLDDNGAWVERTFPNGLVFEPMPSECWDATLFIRRKDD